MTIRTSVGSPTPGRDALISILTLLGIVGGLIALLHFSGDDPDESIETPPQGFVDIPKVDVHVHVPATMIQGAMRIFGRHGVVMAFNASGGPPGERLRASVEAGRHAGGMYSYCFLDWQNAWREGWTEHARLVLDQCVADGGVGLKIFKALGLGYLIDDGVLLRVDEPRLDETFAYAGELGLPVLIHTGDPRAFFEAPTPENERYEELSAHPTWSFHGPRPDGGEWPTWRGLLAQFEARVARHPGTTFIGAHFGNAPEDPDFVERMLDQYPNYVVETGARIPEMGRHDVARMRRLFERHHDRIMFGTDFQMSPGGFILGSVGDRMDTAERIPIFYDAHWRYFETRDRGFEHPSPIQGDWTIDGLGLSEEILRDVYQRNALRVFQLELPAATNTREQTP